MMNQNHKVSGLDLLLLPFGFAFLAAGDFLPVFQNWGRRLRAGKDAAVSNARAIPEVFSASFFFLWRLTYGGFLVNFGIMLTMYPFVLRFMQ